MTMLSDVQNMELGIKQPIRDALEALATAIDLKAASTDATAEIAAAIEAAGYQGSGDALPTAPVGGTTFKVNATSAALGDAPAGAANGDFIIYDATAEAWVLLVDIA